MIPLPIRTKWRVILLAFWLFFFSVVRPPVIWPWERSNYPSRSYNGLHGPKGPKFKQTNKQTKLDKCRPPNYAMLSGHLVPPPPVYLTPSLFVVPPPLPWPTPTHQWPHVYSALLLLMIALLATERPLDYFVPSSQLDGFLGSQIPLSHSSPSWLSKIYRTTLHCTDAKKNSALVAAWRPNS